MQRRPLLSILAPWVLVGTAAAGVSGPDIEERAAATPATLASAAASDAAIAVFEQIEQLQSQIDALNGRVEELEHALEQSRREQKARYLDVDARLGALEQAGAAPVLPPDAAVPAAGPEDEKTQYERSRDLVVKERRFTEAITGFERQLADYPKGEYAPLALYWLGEVWLAVEKPDAAKARRYFERVVAEFPKNSKVPASLYKTGLLQCQAGEQAQGRVTLNKVIVQSPGTPEAKLAATALKQSCQ